jgi:hypothetical protein
MINTIQKRFLLFLIGCIGTRLAIALYAKYASGAMLSALGYLVLLPAIGFMAIYLTGVRRTGAEVFGERIWWNNLRPLHSLLYFVFSYMAINKNRDAWLVLMADVSIGFVSFIGHHYSVGNIQKIVGY